MCSPSQVANTVIGWYSVNVVNGRFIIGVIQECLSDQAMHKILFTFIVDPIITATVQATFCKTVKHNFT